MEHTFGPLNLLLMNMRGTWVLQCLEYDIAAHGATIAEVKRAFVRALVGQAIVNLHHGKGPMEDVPRAHARYWRMYQEASSVSERVDVVADSDGPEGVPPAWMIQALSNEVRLAG